MGDRKIVLSFISAQKIAIDHLKHSWKKKKLEQCLLKKRWNVDISFGSSLPLVTFRADETITFLIKSI
jgi:hypothetical protein